MAKERWWLAGLAPINDFFKKNWWYCMWKNKYPLVTNMITFKARKNFQQALQIYVICLHLHAHFKTWMIAHTILIMFSTDTDYITQGPQLPLGFFFNNNINAGIMVKLSFILILCYFKNLLKSKGFCLLGFFLSE